KIVNRKVYNTETAKEIGNWSNGLPYTDTNYIEETFYKTKKGNYFIYGEGGANTMYSERNGSMSSGSKEIKPVNKEEMISCMEDVGLSDEIEKEFPDLIEEA